MLFSTVDVMSAGVGLQTNTFTLTHLPLILLSTLILDVWHGFFHQDVHVWHIPEKLDS